MKRFLTAALCAALLIGQAPTVLAAAPACGGPVSASCAVLMEAGSGRVLFERNPHERRLIASITKLMTALVALESGHRLEETVTIDPAWTGVEGSSLYLRPGERLRLETLLYGMLLCSGNDAATAVAGYCAGDSEAFAALMNAKARELGMKDSSFANPSGLNAEGHYSSALDMALLARACLEREDLTKMTSTRSITLEGRTFVNHNKLLWLYEGCLGMKTGYTEKAGRTLVSAARRDGMTLICVTLNAPDDWADHRRMLDWGFGNFTTRTLKAGTELARMPVRDSLAPFVPLVAGEDVTLCLGTDEEPRRRLELPEGPLQAPLEKGSAVGTAVYTVGEEERLRVPLVAAEERNSHVAPARRLPDLWGWLE